MTDEKFYNLPGYLFDVLVTLNKYHRRHGKIPAGLVNAVQNELSACPLCIAVSFFTIILDEYPEICQYFLDDDDGGDGDDVGPASIGIETLALKFSETRYHQ